VTSTQLRPTWRQSLGQKGASHSRYLATCIASGSRMLIDRSASYGDTCVQRRNNYRHPGCDCGPFCGQARTFASLHGPRNHSSKFSHTHRWVTSSVNTGYDKKCACDRLRVTLTPRCTVLRGEPQVHQLWRNPPHLWTPEVHYRAHNGSPLVNQFFQSNTTFLY
jgi:hypothetical protein